VTIRFLAPSPAEGTTLASHGVSFRFTYSVRPKATRKLRCVLAGPKSSVGPCNRPQASGKGSRSAKSYTSLTSGSYAFSVLVTGPGGETVSATRHFGIGVAVVALAAGDAHTCALTSKTGVKCWGHNYAGQIGNGTRMDSSAPVDVLGLSSGVTAITAGSGSAHTCALTSGGAVECWGDNSTGQLGTGVTLDSPTPVMVSGLSSGVIAIAAGAQHTCALTQGGAVKCWGLSFHGQLGDGTFTHSYTPIDVVGLSSGVTAITAGGLHTCALMTSGAVKCWGDNPTGELVNGVTSTSSTPVDVPRLSSGVREIAAGASHTCALTNSGAVTCWGDNSNGQLGNGTTSLSSTPVDVSGLSSGVAAIAAGGNHNCALTDSGAVKCWGANYNGMLGNGTDTDSPIPVGVSGLSSGVTAIAAGDGHTCALTTDGPVLCWGWNLSGQLGNDTNTDSSTPVQVFGLSSASRRK
jgi:alpha-tubulin suppressor-like RCC1 family protein